MLEPVAFFKCVSDETRLRCCLLLHREGELCVCELTTALALSQPKISRHLALLRQQGLLTDRRCGQWVYYQLNKALADWVRMFLAETDNVLTNNLVYQQDRHRLNVMKDRVLMPNCR